MLAGLETPSSGEILLRGRRLNEVPANRRPTCMVFQSLALFSQMTVGANIEFALTMRRVGRETRKRRAVELMDLLRLPREFYAKPVTLCSGGERQRVALARALASDPEILFFDEPLSAIDYRLRKILEMEVKDLHRATGKTFVYITHSLEEAMVMSDRIAVMRAGRIVQLGEPLEIYRRPGSRFVAEFMGEVNVIRLEWSGSGWRAPELDLELPKPPPDASPAGSCCAPNDCGWRAASPPTSLSRPPCSTTMSWARARRCTCGEATRPSSPKWPARPPFRARATRCGSASISPMPSW